MFQAIKNTTARNGSRAGSRNSLVTLRLPSVILGDEQSFARCDTWSISHGVLPDERILSYGSGQSRHPRSSSLTKHGTVLVSFLIISPLTSTKGHSARYVALLTP
jgi:hypothetical protein